MSFLLNINVEVILFGKWNVLFIFGLYFRLVLKCIDYIVYGINYLILKNSKYGNIVFIFLCCLFSLDFMIYMDI